MHVYFVSPDRKLQAELAECRAQVEHWQGVATICEQSKQEEQAELQKQYDQEIQSLQEALRGEPLWLYTHTHTRIRLCGFDVSIFVSLSGQSRTIGRLCLYVCQTTAGSLFYDQTF